MKTNPVTTSVIATLMTLLTVALVRADEHRAPPPKFSDREIEEAFFPSLEEALGGAEPDLASLRKMMKAATAVKVAPETLSKAENTSAWARLISATTIEDEVKNLRLHFESLVASPGVFRKESDSIRIDLSALATLFAVITEYSDEVRWKKDAAAARDLLARTAVNARAASPQVFNEAKTRKADLQDLVSGAGLSDRKAELKNDWSKIAGHGLLMAYSERLVEKIEEDTRSVDSTKSQLDEIKRRAELLAMLGRVFTQDGMDFAGDEEYDEFSRKLTDLATQTVSAIARDDPEAVQKNAGMIRTRCDACHEVYR